MLYYELLGSFNKWGQEGSLKEFRFDDAIEFDFCEDDRFKIRTSDTLWLGYERISMDSDNCFSSAPDGFGGLNIYVNQNGKYRIKVTGGHLVIKKA